MRRWPSLMKTTPTTTASAMVRIRTCEMGGSVSQPSTADGTDETMLAKISSEMPLPTPRCVMSSPSHISSTVPAVTDSTIR